MFLIAFEASKIEHSLSWGLDDSIICVTARLMAAEVLMCSPESISHTL